MTVRSQAIKLIGVDDRFTETGHVVVEVGGAYPEVVMFNGDPFIATGDRPAIPDPTMPLQYRKVRPFRFVRKALP
ncbi:hypothetical protein QIH87_14160 [Bradyrhizobium elkanii]|uniref:hypothetical protein n=1 Tax=Bradyrhizobium elkanii TaxID=29448 RepID=UPI001020115B|nr:hypothetical protein [Bradyrhizobium elkanii]MCW2112497.1 hypothetical protein [Bradyrhizobium elkanii]MCW2199146.1 hypothetical protein [Bradyrhizobium elkanii]MCW2229301.1 hypothetical protein [Bradyrhizobium elkanii]NWL38091.1 hypothetical protein [Bradyrhizobium elkanii]RYM15744.1 hypothetical protein EWH13_38550 [Bradyrhizobium elkanii]